MTGPILTVPNVISAVRVAMVPLFLWLLFGADAPLAAGLLPGHRRHRLIDGFCPSSARSPNPGSCLICRRPPGHHRRGDRRMVPALLAEALALVVREGLTASAPLFAWR
jgi:hypothetical protein